MRSVITKTDPDIMGGKLTIMEFSEFTKTLLNKKTYIDLL